MVIVVRLRDNCYCFIIFSVQCFSRTVKKTLLDRRLEVGIMRCNLFLLVCLVFSVACLVESANGDFDGMIDIDEQTPYRGVRRARATDGDSGDLGDDEDDDSVVNEGSGILSDSAVSGSGSGEVDIITVTSSSTTTSTTTVPRKDSTTTSTTTTETEESAETTTEDNIVSTDATEEPIFMEETEEPVKEDEENDVNVVFAGGVGETSTQKTPKADPRVEDKVITVLTTEVIAAVVVGAVCAIILIAFLVYRLRKRDEGSYALSDAGFKDTYKPQGDTGKEAFV